MAGGSLERNKIVVEVKKVAGGEIQRKRTVFFSFSFVTLDSARPPPVWTKSIICPFFFIWAFPKMSRKFTENYMIFKKFTL